MGAELDATNGHVRVRTAAGTGKPLNDGIFWAGRFVISQPAGARGFTNLKLTGGDFGACASSAVASGASSPAQRKLWGKGDGKFNTKGTHGSASVRGTKWLMEDRCDTTRTAVKEGVVETDTNGELVFRISEGQIAEYRCDFDGLEPVSSTFCTAVYYTPEIGQWGAGLITDSDATSYDLCLTDPSSEERCQTYALSERMGRSGLRDSIVICQADRGPGTYFLRWLIDGVQLGPPMDFTLQAAVGQGCVSRP